MDNVNSTRPLPAAAMARTTSFARSRAVHVARSDSASRHRSTKDVPGPRSLFMGGLSGAEECGRVEPLPSRAAPSRLRLFLLDVMTDLLYELAETVGLRILWIKTVQVLHDLLSLSVLFELVVGNLLVAQ
jgi:hypothetical protein